MIKLIIGAALAASFIFPSLSFSDQLTDDINLLEKYATVCYGSHISSYDSPEEHIDDQATSSTNAMVECINFLQKQQLIHQNEKIIQSLNTIESKLDGPKND